MPTYSRMHNYPEGSIIQRRMGYRFIKTNKGMRAEHRVVAEKQILHRELDKCERVFHRDCDEIDNNDASNLVVIRFRTNPFRPLPQTRVIYVPRAPERVAA